MVLETLSPLAGKSEGTVSREFPRLAFSSKDPIEGSDSGGRFTLKMA
jgi:hypothetical protein